MRIELKDFQDIAVKKLVKDINKAKRDALDDDAQAIILSSPTGSGKTVTVTALMENILRGDDTKGGDLKAIFLWISDSPELNEQSRQKLQQASDVFKASDLVIVDAAFDQERFTPGKVYFLNTQKLGKDKSLVTKGDKRTFTIWDTIRNTAEAEPSRFFVVIDEAHKGMAESVRDKAQANSIVQKFIKGSDGEIPPVKLIIGMSATPERFLNILDTSRVRRHTEIEPADVRASGLLKDKIIINYTDESQPSDLSLLQAAVEDWKRFTQEWRAYATAQEYTSPINPVLVVQVEDGDDKKFTKTDLNKVVEIIERAAGNFDEGEIAHCFQESTAIEVGGHKIQKVEASKIQDNPKIKVVLFKMSLTTGWDCPRAEVMMSFRKANDHTLIAQLVGRMVRTPLARRIESSDYLNTVALYLPHYDKAGLKRVVEKLRQPDAEDNLAIDVELGEKLVEVTKDESKKEYFDVLSELPSYSIERIPKSTNIKRFIKLARQLTFDGIDANAWDKAKELVVNTLERELKRLRKSAGFNKAIGENQEISIRSLTFDYGEWKDDDGIEKTIKATPENIEDLFDWCGSRLGEGLHSEYWQKMADLSDPLKAKIELFLVLQDDQAWKNLEDVCGKKLHELLGKYSREIRGLTTSAQEKYRKIRGSAKDPEPISPVIYPETIQVTKAKIEWKDHLYVEKDSKFRADLNEWEQRVLKEEIAKPGFVGWMRNIPRKQWALCVPYKMGGDTKAMYPDFIVLRKVSGKIVVDVFEPHTTSFSDSCNKAVGLAEYAVKHGEFYGRIEMIDIVNGAIKRLNVTDEAVRDKVKRITSNAELDNLFSGV